MGPANVLRRTPSPIEVELDVFARAVGGALLFGTPLLFTMEMWWIGEFTTRDRLGGFLAITFVINVALARLSGFRDDDQTWLGDVGQALEAMAVGIVLSVAVLVSLGRLDSHASLESAIGTIIVQVVPLSIGALVANLVFSPGSDRVHGNGSEIGSPRSELLNDVGATFAGAVFVCFALAPTEEVPMLAAGANAWNVAAIVALSLFASYVIVFASGFDPSHHGPHEGGLFQGPLSETILAYVISMVAAALMLFGFHQIALDDPLHATLTKVLVLAIPATIGGAAGRVVV